ncbi:MAG: TIM barrel protein [Caldilineaceae bacterium]|nr:TIM barrel protein [Caldilineaceae bacterium]
MRLGVVGMLPNDFRTISPENLLAIRSLGLTSACFHVGSELLFEVQTADCTKIKQIYAQTGMDLVQVGIGYQECLFDPDPAVRASVVGKIERGLEIGRELGAHTSLIRTGSLNPTGSYHPSRKNHAPESYARLIETLRKVADKAEQEGQTIVIETHVLTIMNSPEMNAQVVKDVGSDRIRIVMDYVNHFQTIDQVYNSAKRLTHIFDVMGSICPVGHCKDISVGNGFVVHFSEEVPGEGELDLATALRLWHATHPDEYLLLEHLPSQPATRTGIDQVMQLGWTPMGDQPNERYILAARNVHRIAAEAGVPIQ